jgi:hypothetical protein
MVKVQIDLTEQANNNLKIFMIENNLTDKRKAINKILEEF